MGLHKVVFKAEVFDHGHGQAMSGHGQVQCNIVQQQRHHGW